MAFCQASCSNDKQSSLQHARKALLDGAPPEDGGAWVTNAVGESSTPSTDATNRFFGRSFAGTDAVAGEPMFSWITRHYEGLSMEDNEELIRFVLSMEVQKGGLLVAKQLAPNDDDDDDDASAPSYSAMSMIRIYDTTEESKWYQKKVLTPMQEASLFLRQAVVSGFPRAMKDKRWRDTGAAALEIIEVMRVEFDAQHASIMRDDNNDCHWYISMLGTDPDHQGCGQGSQLVRRITELADETGMDCYLEAIGESNKRFYEKFGFCSGGSAVFERPDQWAEVPPVAEGERDVCTAFFMHRKAHIR